MINKTLKYGVRVIFFIIIISCKKDNNNAEFDRLKQVIESNLGQKLIIPDSLEYYKPFANLLNKKELQNKYRYKIYSHIDASCGTCLTSLESWNKLISEFNKRKIQVVLVCTTDDKFELLKYFFESKQVRNFTHPLFLDHKNDFLKKNKFMNINKNFETVLTDNDNTIVLIGNPIMSKEIKDLYLAKN